MYYLFAFAYPGTSVFKLFPLFTALSVKLSPLVGFSPFAFKHDYILQINKKSNIFVNILNQVRYLKSLSTVAFPSHIIPHHSLLPFPSAFLCRCPLSTSSLPLPLKSTFIWGPFSSSTGTAHVKINGNLQ